MNLRADLTFATHVDVVQIGVDDCGSPILGELHLVLAEAPNGQRWVHPKGYCSHERVPCTDPDSEIAFYFLDRRDDAIAAITHLHDRIVARGVVNLDLWNETYPVYGSDAYAEDDAAGLHKAWERARDDSDVGADDFRFAA